MIAAAIVLFSLLAAGNSSESCSLSGHIRNSVTGEPVRKAEVLIEKHGGDQLSYPFMTTSDEQGAFQLAHIEPGRYILRVQRDGYLRGSYSGGFLVLQPGQTLKDIYVDLTPFGVISGRVTSSDGEPMIHAEVRAWQHRAQRGRWQWRHIGNTKTNDLGEYRLTDLSPGSYAVSVIGARMYDFPGIDRSARPRPPESDVPTLYPAAIDFDSAVTVKVGPGERIGGIDIAMLRKRTFHVSGRVESDNNKSRLQNVLIVIESPGGHLAFARQFSAGFSWNGQFDFYGVPAGTYHLKVRDLDQSESVSELLLEVNADIEGLVMTLSGDGSFSGKLRVEGENAIDLNKLKVSLIRDDGAGETANVEADGSFTMQDRQGGGYRFELKGLPDAFYVKSEIGGEIVVSRGAGSIDGPVLDDQQKPVSGAMVVLTPSQTVTTGEQGYFQFKNLAPGDYKLFACGHEQSCAYLEPEFLKQKEQDTVTATISPDGHATVHLTAKADR